LRRNHQRWWIEDAACNGPWSILCINGSIVGKSWRNWICLGAWWLEYCARPLVAGWEREERRAWVRVLILWQIQSGSTKYSLT
jgi:hypothetical protein